MWKRTSGNGRSFESRRMCFDPFIHRPLVGLRLECPVQYHSTLHYVRQLCRISLARLIYSWFNRINYQICTSWFPWKQMQCPFTRCCVPSPPPSPSYRLISHLLQALAAPPSTFTLSRLPALSHLPYVAGFGTPTLTSQTVPSPPPSRPHCPISPHPHPHTVPSAPNVTVTTPLVAAAGNHAAAADHHVLLTFTRRHVCSAINSFKRD